MNQTETTLQRFVTHLPLSTTDRVLVILKGHLLVEEMLREYIKLQVHRADKLQDARLTFHQCLCLARAFDKEESNEKLWSSVEKLNGLRNKLSHSLEPKDVEAKLKEFVSLLSDFKADEGYVDEEKNFGVLASCLLTICLSLSEFLRRAGIETK